MRKKPPSDFQRDIRFKQTCSALTLLVRVQKCSGCQHLWIENHLQRKEDSTDINKTFTNSWPMYVLNCWFVVNDIYAISFSKQWSYLVFKTSLSLNENFFFHGVCIFWATVDGAFILLQIDPGWFLIVFKGLCCRGL